MRINHYVAVLDACVLAPMPVADTLLRLAEEMFYSPRWSEEIMRETKSTLEKFGYTEMQSQRRIDAMNEAFPEAMVEGYEDLIPAMKNHEKDRHVLAAAVRSNAHCVVSANKRHFHDASLAPYNVECLTADDFLIHQYHLDTDGFIAILTQQAARINIPIYNLLASLSVHIPQLAALIKPLDVGLHK
jgi:predicted nucleic acid-binding protein